MARVNEKNIEPVLQAAAVWVQKCLLDQGSIFSDESLWTAENVQHLHKFFIQNPLTDKRDFYEKLKEQLSPAPPQVSRLAAEMLWVIFLFPRSIIKGQSKREDILKVWSWSHQALDPKHPLLHAPMELGVGNPGTAFNTHRYRELQFLIALTGSWLKRSRLDREKLLKDPWAFGAWLSSVDDAGHRQMRHILPYLVFPDTYERTASKMHKQRIAKAYADKVTRTPSQELDETTKTDWKLHEIRKQVEAECPGQGVDFYHEPWKAVWADDKEPADKEPDDKEPDVVGGDESASTNYWWLNANPKIWDLRALPVGGQQTYTAINEKGNKRQKYKHFEAAQPGDLVIGYVASPDKEVVATCRITKALHESPNDNGRLAIEFEKTEAFEIPVTFKELQNIKDLQDAEPIENNQGSLFALTQEQYELIHSILDERNPPTVTTVEPYSLKNALSELFIDETTLKSIRDALLYKKSVILQGPPGVGKTFMAKRLAYMILGAKDDARVQMIQFHQSYSYEDFIQGYRPTDTGDFDLKNGVFYEFAKRAQRDSDNRPHFFIIDEINRANLGKVFGELMLLVEPDKRGPEFAVPLTYAESEDDIFYLPANLHIIGTMNTADRSISMVDYALRRRFRFIHLEPQYGRKFRDHLTAMGVSPEIIEVIVGRMQALNNTIEADTKNLGRGFKVGHSFFCPLQPVVDSSEWYTNIIDMEIAPQLDEYWFDDPEKAKTESDALRL